MKDAAMKKIFLLAALAALVPAAQAQDIYAGFGLPGLYTLGYALPLNPSVGLRVEYASGLSLNRDGNQEGVNVTGNFKSSRLGAFADWFPMGGGFRLVGGLTAHDTRAEFNALGSGTSSINGTTVNMAGETYRVTVKYPDTTAYLGIGYGHQQSEARGLGFYADVGVSLGNFSINSSTSLVGKQGITQADVDAQNQKIRDSLNGYSVLPSASLGLLYRY
jgi:hypothetical protein